ncbi:MAG: hypothetical protein V5A55_14780 [Halovenus sp.]
MRWRRPAGSLVVATVAVVVVGILTSLVTRNTLLFDSVWQAAAFASLGFVAVVLALFVAVGRPWRRRLSSSYW